MDELEQFVGQLEETPAWEQRDGEPHLWYERFEFYRLLGPDRSIREAYLKWCALYGEQANDQPGSPWYRVSQAWNWVERAEAWDKQQRNERRKAQAAAVVEAQQRNQAALNMAIDEAEAAIGSAKGSDKRLWIDTLVKVTSDRRKEFGYDVQRVQEVDPGEVIEIPWPEDAVNDD
jgi:hypothetical protein